MSINTSARAPSRTSLHLKVTTALLLTPLLLGCFPIAAVAADELPEVVVEVGHTAPLYCAKLSHNGQFVITASQDGTFKQWSVATGELLQTFRGADHYRREFEITADDAYIFGISKRYVPVMLEIATGKAVPPVSEKRTLFDRCALSGDGKRLAASSPSGMTTIWEVGTWKEIHNARVTGERKGLECISLNNDGTLLATGYRDGAIELWSVADKRTIKSFAGNKTTVECLRFSDDGQYLASGGDTAILWRVETGEKVHAVEAFVLDGSDIDLSGDGKRFVTRSHVREAILWGDEPDKALRTFEEHQSALTNVDLSPDGTILLIGEENGVAKLWNTETGALIQHFGRSSDMVTKASLDERDDFLVVATDANRAHLFHLPSGKRYQSYPNLWSHDAEISLDGKRVLTQPESGRIVLREVLSGRVTSVFKAPFSFGTATISDGGEFVAAGVLSRVVLWNATTRAKMSHLHSHDDDVDFAVFSEGGALLVTASGDGPAALVWDTALGELLYKLEGNSSKTTCLALPKRGNLLVTGCQNGAVTLWNVDSGEKLRSFSLHAGSVKCAAVSSDAKIIATGSNGKSVVLWDAETTRQLKQLDGHQGPVVSAQFNKDNQRLFTGSQDGTVRAWDVPSGRCLFALYQLNDGKDWLAVTPKGHFDGSPDAERQLQCRLPGRDALESIAPYREKLKVDGLMGKVLRGEQF